ncbi:MAG: arylesterase [Gammaproteobacteria bacterium]|nr:arylesterase [Gammaproteobacteria bacterium]
MFRPLFVILCCWAAAGHAVDDRILVLGDSLSAAYGIRLEQGWVALLEARLSAQGYRYRVVNASISGDTSRSALTRLEGLLREGPPAIAIVELGGNDGLRGIALDEFRANLDQIAARLVTAGSRVLLIPMRIPPNYGPAYAQGFEQIYRDVAQGCGAVLGDFLLEDIALRQELMQEDGIHPRAEAQTLMLDRVWRSLEPMLAAQPLAADG